MAALIPVASKIHREIRRGRIVKRKKEIAKAVDNGSLDDIIDIILK